MTQPLYLCEECERMLPEEDFNDSEICNYCKEPDFDFENMTLTDRIAMRRLEREKCEI